MTDLNTDNEQGQKFMTKKRILQWLGVIISLILITVLFASCSTDTPNGVSPNDQAPEEADSLTNNSPENTEVINDIADIFSDSSETNESSQKSNAIPAGSEFDGDVPVGFTESGNPYRGNLDAPVVLEEFSDFQ